MTVKVTFGFVNCNRLYYLRSCIESLLISTVDFSDKEIIVIDNASVEEGTEEYLASLEERGFTVIRREERDPANEFAKGLNTICELAKGDFVVPLQGDMQFVLTGGWLQEYVQYAEAHPEMVGCITLDAQRTVTNGGHQFAMDEEYESDYQFVVDLSRDPVAGAADVFYPKAVLDAIYPWHIRNLKHEGGDDSETAMLKKVKGLIEKRNLPWRCISPVIPVAVAIYTDSRGTNARVRNNRRYGDYWAPKEDLYRYYEMIDFQHAITQCVDRKFPVGIEEMVSPVGFPKPVDEKGHWLKNPIRPETAQSSDYVDLIPDETALASAEEDEKLLEWLNS